MKEEDCEYTVYNDECECAICYENVCHKEDVLEPCGHYIHKNCFLKTKSNLCPICRQIVIKPIPNITLTEQFLIMRDENPITINQVACITSCICLFYTILIIIEKGI
jgi:Prokaryotic RING finger family 4